MSEKIADYSNLSIEHIMPQSWEENWPLIADSTNEDELEKLRGNRNSLIHNIGNLTVLTNALNSSVSNSGWEIKRAALSEISLLEINRKLTQKDSWDDEEIKKRSTDLAKHIVHLWPR